MRVEAVPLGIDEVTPEWLAGLLGPVDRVTSTRVGEGFGLGGETHRVETVAEGVPGATVAVKFASAIRTERELAFYEHCAETTPVRLVGCLGGAVDHAGDRGVLVMEYLDGVRQGDVLVGCSLDEAHLLADALGRLHGRWWGAAAPELVHVARANAQRSSDPPVLREGHLGAAQARYADTVSADMGVVFGDLERLVPAAHAELAVGPQTLIHTDFHLDNVLFTAEGAPYVIDWQGATIGAPEVDVARLLVECVSVEQRRRHGDDLLATFRAAVRDGGGGPAPDLERRVRDAWTVSVPPFINWIGRPLDQPNEPRTEALIRNLVVNLSAAIADG